MCVDVTINKLNCKYIMNERNVVYVIVNLLKL